MCAKRFALLSKYPSHGATTDLEMSNTVVEAMARFLNWAKTRTWWGPWAAGLMGQCTGASEGVKTANLDHCTNGLESGPWAQHAYHAKLILMWDLLASPLRTVRASWPARLNVVKYNSHVMKQLIHLKLSALWQFYNYFLQSMSEFIIESSP